MKADSTDPGTDRFQQFQRSNLTLYYQTWGDAKTASPLVFLHGWAGSSQDWQPLLPYLALEPAGLIYDSAGFGRSQFLSDIEAKQADFSLARYVEDLKELLDEVGYERVRLVGHSWGGVVAMEFAARYPEKVVSLVAIGSAYFDPARRLHQVLKWASYLIGWLIVVLKKPLRNSVRLRRWAVKRYFKNQPDPLILDRLMEEVVGSDNRAIIQSLLAGYQVQFRQICPKINSPTLYIGCQNDVVAPPSYVKPFVPLTPQASYELIPDCGHFPMLEKPAQLTAILNQFWENS